MISLTIEIGGLGNSLSTFSNTIYAHTSAYLGRVFFALKTNVKNASPGFQGVVLMVSSFAIAAIFTYSIHKILNKHTSLSQKNINLLTRCLTVCSFFFFSVALAAILDTHPSALIDMNSQIFNKSYSSPSVAAAISSSKDVDNKKV